MELTAFMPLVTKLPARRFAQLMDIIQDIRDELPRNAGSGSMARSLASNPQFVRWAAGIATRLQDVPFDRFVRSFALGVMVRGHARRQAFALDSGYYGPAMISVEPVSPAGERMGSVMLGGLLEQAREIGAHIVMMSGRACLDREVLDVIDGFEDMIFVARVSPDRIDPSLASRLMTMGNVWPALELHVPSGDQSALDAMDLLRAAGVMFGVSVELDSINSDVVSDDCFVDPYIDGGAFFFLGSQYVPVDGDVEPIPTPRQREVVRERFRHWQRTRPILMVDPCSDGACLGGCLAASRTLHVEADGAITPCERIRFSTCNLGDCTLTQALESRFMTEIRNSQPCDQNLLRPCAVTDHPDILRTAVDVASASASRPGADAIVRNKKLMQHLDRYSRQWAEIAHVTWRSKQYEYGHEAPFPFMGEMDVYRCFPSRMQHGYLVSMMRKAMKRGYDPAMKKKRKSIKRGSWTLNRDLLGAV